MKVFIKDKAIEVELPDTYISGGEGDVYIKDGWAYKIYHDIKKSLNEEKFNELKQLDKDNIIKPESLLYNNKNIIIGYVMKAVPKCFPLSRLITNDFRKQYNINNDQILKIIQNMKETFEYIHSKGCLVIDGNEMNYLIDENFEHVYFIDVDSYQTQKHNGNAYSPSTLDPIAEKNRKFSVFSDWFIFAVVSCTLLVGIHPFKGSYKGLSRSFKKGDLKSRMQSNLSIFNNKVSVNSAVRDFSIVPSHYKDWFLGLFENGFRIEPPKNIFDVTANLKCFKKQTVFNGKVKSSNVYSGKIDISDVYISDYNSFIMAKNTLIDLKTNKKIKFTDNKTQYLEIDNKPFLLKLEKTIKIFNIETGVINDTKITSNNYFIINNRIYSIYNNKLNELKFIFGKLIIENSWDILDSSIDLFKNVIIQKIYNRNIVYIPFESNCCSIVNMVELNDCNIINAFYENKMLELIVFKDGEYKRNIFKFADNFKRYEIILEEYTDNFNINAIALDNGVFISNFKDGEFFMTLNRLDKKDINIIKDSNINIRNALLKNKNEVYLVVDNEINKITLTK